MLDQGCIQILSTLGIEPDTDPDSILDSMHSNQDGMNLSILLEQYKVSAEEFWKQILYSEGGIPNTDGGHTLTAENLDYKILPYNPIEHDITELASKFQEEVVGGERAPSPEPEIYVAIDSTNKILGYITLLGIGEGTDIPSNLGGSAYFLDEIVVDEKVRRNSIGRKLHDYLVSKALHDEAHCIFTNAHNMASHFFESIGYQQLGNGWSNDYGQVFHEMALPLDEVGEKLLGEISANTEPISVLN